MTMTRPSFNLSDAARLTGVSRSTMRRYREAGDFPDAYKNTDKQWMIPLENLLAKGLKPIGEVSRTVTLTGQDQDHPQAGPVDAPNPLADEVAKLRTELAVERAQREGVENLLTEVRRRADLAEMALRQIEAPKGPVPADPAPTPPPAQPVETTVPEAPKKRWWNR